MSKAKQKGTAAETAVVRYLRTNGYPLAERRALSGKLDKGDIAGVPDVVIEVKAAEKCELKKWLAETRAEAVNAGTPFGVLVVKVKYKPIERWDAWMPLAVLAPHHFDTFPLQEDWTWVRMDLRLAVAMLVEMAD